MDTSERRKTARELRERERRQVVKAGRREKHLKEAERKRKKLGKGQRKKKDDEEETQEQTHPLDDEYQHAGAVDPKIMVTTSHDPSQKLTSFAKELRLLFPNAVRFNRGRIPVKELVANARQYQFSDVVVVHETKGVPDTLILQHMPYGPTFYYTLYNVVMRHDIPDVGPMSEQYPNLIFDNFHSKIGMRVSDGLKYLFPVTKDPEEASRVVTFQNNDDFISFRHHTYQKERKSGNSTLREVGPRFEMRLFKIMQGTMDMDDAKEEWKLRSFMNSKSGGVL